MKSREELIRFLGCEHGELGKYLNQMINDILPPTSQNGQYLRDLFGQYDSFLADFIMTEQAELRRENEELKAELDCRILLSEHNRLMEEQRWQQDNLKSSHAKVLGEYNELIMAVENKYEGETRHQTAWRYIKTQANRHEAPASSAIIDKQKDKV
jgi:hypothetical protein